jgi:hypothetical protein
MLHLIESALTPEFVKKTIGGLLLVFNENEGTRHLGWIKSAEVQKGKLKVELGRTIFQKIVSGNDWERLTNFVFEADFEGYTALDDIGGFHCSDGILRQPNFKIFPASSIPPTYGRTIRRLVLYGDAFKDAAARHM